MGRPSFPVIVISVTAQDHLIVWGSTWRLEEPTLLCFPHIQSNSNVCQLFVDVGGCICACLHTHKQCGGSRLMSGVFLHYFLLYVLTRICYFSPECRSLASLTRQLAPRIPSLILGLQVGIYVGAGDPDSSPYCLYSKHYTHPVIAPALNHVSAWHRPIPALVLSKLPSPCSSCLLPGSLHEADVVHISHARHPWPLRSQLLFRQADLCEFKSSLV